MTARIRAVSFDLDGTLYELRPTRLRMLAACFPRWRTLRVGRAVREELRGRSFATGAALLDEEARVAAERLERDAPTTKALLHELFNVRLARVLETTGPRSGVRAVLQQLVDDGVKIAVISDRGHVAAKLAALGLHDLPWSALVSADDEGVLKPGAALFARCAERCGVGVGDMVHIGDRDDADGAGARAAGCGFVFVQRPGPLPPLGLKPLALNPAP